MRAADVFHNPWQNCSLTATRTLMAVRHSTDNLEMAGSSTLARARSYLLVFVVGGVGESE